MTTYQFNKQLNIDTLAYLKDKVKTMRGEELKTYQRLIKVLKVQIKEYE